MPMSADDLRTRLTLAVNVQRTLKNCAIELTLSGQLIMLQRQSTMQAIPIVIKPNGSEKNHY